MKTRSLLSLLLFLLLPPATVAQRQDVRISPEPVSYALPADIRIESADRVGDVTLVVWGSTRFAADSTVVNALYVQMVDGATPIGEPRVLHTAEARPSGFVRVLALQGKFLVVWNDARIDAPGLYMQRVALDGTNEGAEERFAAGRLTTMALSAVNRLDLDDGGVRLVWNDVRADSAGVYTVRLGSDGSIVEGTRRLGDGRIVRELRYDSLPGLRVLLREKHAALLVYSDGTVESRSVAGSHFRWPFYLNPDTSIVEVVNKELRYYRSIFDSAAFRTVALQALDSAIANTTVVTHDSTKGTRVIYAVTTVSGDLMKSGWFTLSVYSLSVSDTGSVIQDSVYTLREIQGHWTWWGKSYTLTSYKSGSVEFGCSNSVIVRHTLESISGVEGYLPNTSSYMKLYSINGDGEVDVGGTDFFNVCWRQPDSLLWRLQSDSLSSVELQIHGDSLVMRTATRSVQLEIPQFQPVIVNRANTLVVGWLESRTSWLGSFYKWQGYESPASELLKQLLFPSLAPHFEQYQIIEPSSRDRALQLKTANNSLLLMMEQHYIDRFKQSTSASIERGYTDQLFYTSVEPEHSDLQALYGVDESDVYWGNRSYWLYGWSWNPNDLGMMIQWRTGFMGEVSRSIVSTAKDSLRWVITTESTAPYIDIIALNGEDYLAISSDRVDQFRKDNFVDSLYLPPATGTPVYVRLLGDQFLRYYDIDSLHLQLELFDLHCRLQSSRLIEFTNNPLGLFVVQRPSDSALALLWGGRNGVRATFLTNHLDIIAHDSAISVTRNSVRNPSGVFRNDTLYCVWEDYRNGVPDIYGTGFALPTLSVRTDRPEGRGLSESDPRNISIVRILPNPTVNGAAIEFIQPEAGSVVIDVIDAMGRRVAVFDLGVLAADRHARVVDVSSLDPGVYTILLRSGIQSDRQRLIVLR